VRCMGVSLRATAITIDIILPGNSWFNGKTNNRIQIFCNVDDVCITAQVKMVLLNHRSTSVVYTQVETENGVHRVKTPCTAGECD
jgi:hypothetical protein